MDNLFSAAERFSQGDRVTDVREFGGGNINNTFLVTTDAKKENRFILQLINTNVFYRPELVMQNMRVCTGHMRRSLERFPKGPGRRWEVPAVKVTDEGADHWLDPEGSFWRALGFIEGSRSFETIRDEEHAGEVGYALGMFHTLLSGLPSGMLYDTLEGFHITPRYLKHHDDVIAECGAQGSPEVNYCLKAVSSGRGRAGVLEDARKAGRLHPRTIHGDPKVDNIMMDETTGRAVGIVDLDTVKPGLVHYDIGDCLRSGCNRLGEETKDWEDVRFDTDLCRAILKGYLSVAGGFLTRGDYDHIYDAVRLIAFELGLRFLTDYLEGDVYFKVKSREQNLLRALVQFKLAESIELQESAIRSIVRDAI